MKIHVDKYPLSGLDRSQLYWLVQCFVHLSIIFLCATSLVPGVNESHYLPKAKHAWDRSYASGGDLFLESHDSHFLATAAAGLASWVFPLSGVAWLGRVASWMLLAFAWLRLTRSLGFSAWFQPLSLITWFLATKYGHWAGEWAIGGFEAKSVAYPLVLLGLANAIEERWSRCWLWLGLAVAWHPLVGGWAGLTVGIAWLRRSQLRERFRRDVVWLGLATVVGLIGVIPAAMGIGNGLAADERVAPAQVHVYYRLAHHMCPQAFAFERHVAAVMSLVGLVVATLAWFRYMRRAPNSGLGFVLEVAWIAVSVSLLGLIIDLGLSVRRPDIAASLLRFYWFRWADVIVPLAWTVTLWSVFQQHTFAKEADNKLRPTALGGYLYGVCFLLTSALFGLHVQQNLNRKFPEADELLMEATGPFTVTSNRHLDWLAVCQWISENTPADSLWLTPKYQQTFKWYAGRAEVVAWKDVPQDNAAVVEWYRRIQRCSPPRDANGQIREWSTDELVSLSNEYQFEWILLDRTYQQTPPILEILYPIQIENRSFAVCRIRRRTPASEQAQSPSEPKISDNQNAGPSSRVK